MDSDLDYCLDQLRRFDRDRYLTVLAAPRDAAADLAVLFAFNLELAVIRDSVTEPMLARIRLQWWREALDGVFAGAPRRHAVLTPLAELATRRRLTRDRFERMIAARESEVDGEPPADMAALEGFAADTAGSLLALAAEACGFDADAGGLQELIRHAGAGIAFAGIARATLHLARHRRTLLPQALLEAHGVSLDRVYELKPQPQLQAALAELVGAAREHLAAARRHRAPKALLPALRQGTLARAQLKRLATRGYDLFDPRSVEASPGDIWRLALKRMKGSW